MNERIASRSVFMGNRVRFMVEHSERYANESHYPRNQNLRPSYKTIDVESAIEEPVDTRACTWWL